MTNEEIIARYGITFEDKNASLPIDSVYIVTAANVNEIKDVVNRLVLKANGEKATFNELFKFVQIVIPKSLNSDKNYDLLLDFSSTSGFSNGTLSSISLSADSEKFKIFKDDEWNSFSNSYIGSSDFKKDVIIDVSSNLLPESPTYIRYRFASGNESTEYCSFAVGTNDFQSYIKDAVPYCFIENTQTTPSSLIESNDKAYIENSHIMIANVQDAVTEIIPFLKAYVLLNGSLTDATSVTAFSIDSTSALADGESRLVTITATTNHNGSAYINKYACIVFKDKLIDSTVNVHYMRFGSGQNISAVFQTTRFGVDYSTPNDISIDKLSLNGIRVNNNIQRDDTAILTVNDRQYPISLVSNGPTAISATVEKNVLSGTSNDSLSTSFDVKSINVDHSKANVTMSNNLNIYELYKDSDNALSLNRALHSVTAISNPKDKDHVLLFEYKTNGKCLFDLVTLSTHYDQPPVPVNLTQVDLKLGTPNANGQFNASTSAYYDDGSHSAANATLTFGPHLSSVNATTLGKKVNSTHYDITDQIQSMYTEDNRTSVDYKFRRIENQKYLKKLVIDGPSNVSLLEPGTAYPITASAVYSDGTKKNVTSSTTFSVPYTSTYDVVSNAANSKTITAGNMKTLRSFILDGSYAEGDVTLIGEKSLMANWLGLLSTNIIGESKMIFGALNPYCTSAFYTNSTSKKVSADYDVVISTEGVPNWIMTDLTEYSTSANFGGSWPYDPEDIEVGTHTIGSMDVQEPLYDIDFTLRSLYTEDDDSKRAEKSICIYGGEPSSSYPIHFKSLNFTLVVADGSTPMPIAFNGANDLIRTDNAYLSSDYSDFYEFNENTTITSSVVQNRIRQHTTHKYDWIEISGNGSSALIPFDCLSTGYASVVANQPYQFTFKEMISSCWCSGNAYPEAKEMLIYDIEVRR